MYVFNFGNRVLSSEHSPTVFPGPSPPDAFPIPSLHNVVEAQILPQAGMSNLGANTVECERDNLNLGPGKLLSRTRTRTDPRDSRTRDPRTSFRAPTAPGLTCRASCIVHP